jgi:inhibitor of cysteine peptidase
MSGYIKTLGGLLIVGLLLLTAGLGCDSESSELPQPVTVTEDDAGNAVELQQGQELIVRLAGNPSTGYEWQMSQSGLGGLEEATGSPAFESDLPEGENRPGAGGTEVWNFTARATGQLNLSFEYKRSWEQDVPATKTVSYVVEVK